MLPAVVAFDLDGTLVDTAPDLVAALNHALARLGVAAVPAHDVRAMVGHGARRLVERGLAAAGVADAALIDQGVAHFLDHYRANIAVGSRPFDGVERALDSLSARGARLAICTNKPEALTLALLGALGWQGRFAAVLGADSRPWRKPDPRHLTDTLEAAGSHAGDAVYVGDSLTDSLAASAAGVPFVLVGHGYSAEPLAAVPADARIDHFDALEPVVAALLQARFRAGGQTRGP
jgi:phosphoglycolate phosphatase